jgi:hypothetical protein
MSIRSASIQVVGSAVNPRHRRDPRRICSLIC